MVIGRQADLQSGAAVSLSSRACQMPARKAFEVFWTRSQEVAQIAALIAAEARVGCNIFPDQPTWPASSTNAECRC